MSFIAIRYQDRVAVLAGYTRVWPQQWLCELPPAHPNRRLVFYMCHYARLVLEGQVPGPYTDAQARRFARLALLSDQADDLQARPYEDDQDVAARVGTTARRTPARPRGSRRAGLSTLIDGRG